MAREVLVSQMPESIKAMSVDAPGITQIDYFATQALRAILLAPCGAEARGENDDRDAVARAYKIGAMMFEEKNRIEIQAFMEQVRKDFVYSGGA